MSLDQFVLRRNFLGNLLVTHGSVFVVSMYTSLIGKEKNVKIVRHTGGLKSEKRVQFREVVLIASNAKIDVFY